ncbi:unnamed protein product [Triticum turgidum subsp. durum]|uniref:Uncharacterized protein n=1 Tax=Triticum turgidum subsp. durum TaxID=4567 RepID=A0A9R0Y9T0_TRITD|nr:unnamed protein product [Triticum turgidum subsp. durum]
MRHFLGAKLQRPKQVFLCHDHGWQIFVVREQLVHGRAVPVRTTVAHARRSRCGTRRSGTWVDGWNARAIDPSFRVTSTRPCRQEALGSMIQVPGWIQLWRCPDLSVTVRCVPTRCCSTTTCSVAWRGSF